MAELCKHRQPLDATFLPGSLSISIIEGKSMKTESHSIHDVLAKNATSFFIPPFQRAYAWGRPEIERFLVTFIELLNLR